MKNCSLPDGPGGRSLSEYLFVVDALMPSPSRSVGLSAGVAGTALCCAAGATRLTGSHYLAGFENGTLFTVGSAFMIFACMVRLYWPDNK